MNLLSERLDRQLVDLAWSLWTELGVAGVHRAHQQFMISPEELILVTARLQGSDPRLVEEALDWCSRYHHFISVSRLKTLAKSWGKVTIDAFSMFSATLNRISRAHWPVLTHAVPLKCQPSGKSKAPRFEQPALLLFRLRSLFGVSARADVIAFYLAQKQGNYSISDVREIGYTKRNLADVLESFVQAGIFDSFFSRNQLRFGFAKRKEFEEILEPLPRFMPAWRQIFELIIPLRDYIQQIEKKSQSTRVVEVRNVLRGIEDQLKRLKLAAPPMQSDFQLYWDSLSEWTLGILPALAG